MSRFLLGNLFLLASMGAAASSQILLKGVLRELDDRGVGWEGWRALAEPERVLRGGVALTLIAAGFVCWVLALRRLELSYAYPIACSSILIVALLSALFLGETMTWRGWAGSLAIVVGIILLMPDR